MSSLAAGDDGPGWLAPKEIRATHNGAAKSSPLAFEWAGDAKPVLDGLWLVDDWLPKAGIGAVYGHPGSGKSFLALDMAIAIAEGREWAGRHVERGLVLYVVAEGQSGFRNRISAAIAAGRLDRTAPLALVTTALDLQAEKGDTGRLIGTLEYIASRTSHAPALVVIDTLSKTFGEGQENGSDMATYVANCQRIASAFECLVLIVHHRPKDSESRDLRGHGSLRAGIDTAILVEAGQVKSATTIKQKDGEDNQVVHFTLEPVVLGEDRRGKEISTCLVNIAQADERVIPHRIDRAKRELKGHARTALRVIEEMIAKDGKEPPADIPVDAIDRYRTWHAIPSGQVSDRLEAEFYALVGEGSDKKPDSARRTAQRTLSNLKDKQILGSWKDWLWLN